MANRFHNVFCMVVAFLEKHDLDYAIIGGIANQVWGQARFTYDIDVKIKVPDSDYDKIRSLVTQSFSSPGRTGGPATPLIISVEIEDIVVDFLMTIPGYDELVVQRAKKYELDDLSFQVCSAEDLIILKAIAGRLKDWQDIEGILIEQQSKLDWSYIDNWLAEFAKALEEPAIVLRWQKVRNDSRLEML